MKFIITRKIGMSQRFLPSGQREALTILKLPENFDFSSLEKIEKVRVTARSKGKGFAGVIKRHGFARGPETHGSNHHRAPGSIGSSFPQRVIKGKKMPGRMGGKTITIKNLPVINVDVKNNLLILKGSIPGSPKAPVQISFDL